MMCESQAFCHRVLLLLTLVICLAIALPAFAVNPDEVLPDPGLEARAREISAQLRCLVCQNETIDDSDADLARDLRILVRERLVAGDTNQQVKDFVVARYGEYVLLKPPVNLRTILLWASPLALLLLGLAALIAFWRNRAGQKATGVRPLSDEECQKLSDILKD